MIVRSRLGLLAVAVSALGIAGGCAYYGMSDGDDEEDVSEQFSALGVQTGRSLASPGEARLYSTALGACFVGGNGLLKCWGNNSGGELGIGRAGGIFGDEPGETGMALPAVKLGDGLAVRSVVGGVYHSCALLSDSTVKCWGTNTNGVLGVPSIPVDTVIGDVSSEMGNNLQRAVFPAGAGKIRALAAMSYSYCALDDRGDVYCWGTNDSGQLGLGDVSPRVSPAGPVLLGTGRKAVALAGGVGHVCAILDTGALKCWGNNGAGQLGTGDLWGRGFDPSHMGDALPAVSLGVDRKAVAVTAGLNHTCARLDDGTVKCWGANDWGQLALGHSNPIMGPQLARLGVGRTARSITAGVLHTCAILDNGKVKCWGQNHDALGQIGVESSDDTIGGSATTVDDNLPYVNLGTLRTARSVSAGAYHTCAWLDDGSVKCWGYAEYGQLGNGSASQRGGLVGTMGDRLPAVYLNEGIALGSFSQHTCTILGEGGLKCWGAGGSGRLGVGSTANLGDGAGEMSTALAFVSLGAGRTVRQATAGGAHSCGIRDDGALFCWGSNTSGQLGRDNVTQLTAPPATGINLGSGRTAVSVGAGSSHTCVLLDNGDVKCWGEGGSGQLGLGATDDRGDGIGAGDTMAALPRVPLPAQASALTVGALHTCALLVDGRLACWGENADGELGIGSVVDQWSPVIVNVGTTAVKQVVAGGTNTCALFAGGALKCWGWNDWGQLGLGNTSEWGDSAGETPAQLSSSIPLGSPAVSVSVGGGFICALTEDSRVKCWGYNAQGTLGISSTDAMGDLAGEVAGLTGVPLGTGATAVSVECGMNHVCALLGDGSRKCWGNAFSGQLGLGDTASRGDGPNEMGDNLPAIQLGVSRPALQVVAGNGHSCAVLESGPVKCWGRNDFGQLGVGDNVQRGTATSQMFDALPAARLGSGRSARSLAGGERHTCALLDNGQVKCWGDNDKGQLGLGDVSPRGDGANEMNDNLAVVDLGPGRTAVAVTAGFAHSCAHLDNGTVKCWGANVLGQLGQGDQLTRGAAPSQLGDELAPIEFGAGRTVRGLTTWDDTSCVLLDNGTVKCWGGNTYRGVGLNEAATVHRGDQGGEMGDGLPVLSFGGQRAVQVFPSCAVLESNQMWCWGHNQYGQVGTANTTVVPAPTGPISLGTATALQVAGGPGAAGLAGHRCVVLDNGTLKCWGNNTWGQLGLGLTAASQGGTAATVPGVLPAVSLPTGRSVVQVAAGRTHTCAVLDNGAVGCWGSNTTGQLGIGTTAANKGRAVADMGNTLALAQVGATGLCGGGECGTASACAPSTVTSDGNACTNDTCDPAVGVRRTFVPAGWFCGTNRCTDAKECTGQGQCADVSEPVIDTSNPCRVGSCSTATGLVTYSNAPINTPCNDNNLCTTADKCTAGVCGGTAVAIASDCSECTVETCDPATGAFSYVPKPMGTPCAESSGTVCSGIVTESPGKTCGIVPIAIATESRCVAVVAPAGSASIPTGPPPPTPAIGSQTFESRVDFLYKVTGTPPQQPLQKDGNNLAQLDDLRVGVVRGRVTDGAAGLVGVKVQVAGHPQQGSVLTRPDGYFDIAVNGGGSVRLMFDKANYLASDRDIHVPWHEYAVLKDVVLVAKPAFQPLVTLSSVSTAVTTGVALSGSQASQPAALLIPHNVTARTVNGGVPSAPLTTATVSAVEYTVGASGRASMPASLPPTTAYTYAVDFRLKEAEDVGATDATFSPGLPFYVKSVLSYLPDGSLDPANTLVPGNPVPAARYDRGLGEWVPEDNGVVVKIVSVSSGAANLDTNSNADVDNGAALGITLAERQRLAEQFAPVPPEGILLWRVLVDHFSPWDLNWPRKPPECDEPSCSGCEKACPDDEPPPPEDNDPPNPCKASGSIIECESQVLGEQIDVAGTPLTLNYRTSRTPGFKGTNTIRIPLTRSLIHSELKEVRYYVDIAGRRHSGSIVRNTPAWAPNASVLFTWDGKDAYNRDVFGPQKAWVTVEHVFPAIYTGAAAAVAGGTGTVAGASTAAFGMPSPTPAGALSGNRARDEVVFTYVNAVPVGVWDARSTGLGGWTLSEHHRLDPETKTLYRGDGETVKVKTEEAVITRHVGWEGSQDPRTAIPPSGPALDTQFHHISDFVVAPDGALLIGESEHPTNNVPWHIIRKVDRNGVVSLVGGIVPYASGSEADGIPATSARFTAIKALALGPDGALYVGEKHKVRRIKDGIVTTVAGNGDCVNNPITSPPCFTPSAHEGRLATSVPIGGAGNDVDAIAVTSDGTLYIHTASNFFRVSPGPTPEQGIISRFVAAPFGGGSEGALNGDCGPIFGAVSATATGPGLDVGPSGDLYLASDNRIRRFGQDGIVNSLLGHWAGAPDACRQRGASGSGGSPFIPPTGVQAHIAAPSLPGLLDVSPGGDIYYPASNYFIQKLDTAGWVTTIAGIYPPPPPNTPTNTLTNIPATRAYIHGLRNVRVGPDGTVYFVNGLSRQFIHQIRPVGPAAMTGCAHVAASKDGSELYCFDATGRHEKTFDAHARPGMNPAPAPKYAFGYSGAYLSSVTTPGAGPTPVPNVTNITSVGAQRRITAPHGQQTNVTLNTPSFTATSYATTISRGSSTYQVQHGTSGLLTQYTDADGNTYNFDYNQLGLLTVDREPLYTPMNGATPFRPEQKLNRTEYTDASGVEGYDVTRTTPMGRVTKYSERRHPNGDLERIQTWPNGLATTTKVLSAPVLSGTTTVVAAGTVVTTLPDRTVIESTRASDPRAGHWSSFTSEKKTKLPAAGHQPALTRIETRTRSTTQNAAGELLTETDVTELDPGDLATTSTYSGAARTMTVSSAASRQTRTTFDDVGRVVKSEILPVGPIVSTDISYDSRGRIQTITRGSRVRTLGYATSGNGAGYLQSDQTSAQLATTFARDPLGRALTSTHDGLVTQQQWTPGGRLSVVKPPGSAGVGEHAFTYNQVGLMQTYEPPFQEVEVAQSETVYGYNADRQLDEVLLPTSTFDRTLSYDYFPGGALKQIATPEGTYDHTYYAASTTAGHAPGRLQSVTAPNPVGSTTLALEYAGPLTTKATWSGNGFGSVRWKFNDLFWLSQETVSDVDSPANCTSATPLNCWPVQLSHDPDGLPWCASTASADLTAGTCDPAAPATNRLGVARTTWGALDKVEVGAAANAVKETFTYNPHGEVATHGVTRGPATGVLLFSETLHSTGSPRDTLGRIVQNVEDHSDNSLDQILNYQYDNQNRLWKVTKGTTVTTYSYDANGNREEVVVTVGGAVTGGASAEFDRQDRMTSYGAYTYTYTDNGELLTKTNTANGELTRYTYDSRGNLVHVALPGGATVEYSIDGENRRVRRKKCLDTLCAVPQIRHWVYHDGLRIAAELDGAGQLVTRFVYATDRHTPDFMVRMEGIAPSQVVKVYRIVSDHLGSPRYVVPTDLATGAAVASAQYDAFGEITGGTGIGDIIPMGFAGGHYDVDTRLVRFGARDYDPVAGRWTNKDPIRFDGGQSNIYVYVGNDPVNYIDVVGLSCESDIFNTALTCMGAVLACASAAATAGGGGLALGGCVLASAACGGNAAFTVESCRPPPPPCDPAVACCS